MAARLTAHNNPKKLILKAPYDNVASVAKMHHLFLPTSLLNYTNTSDQFLQATPQTSVTIFHGDEDEVILLNCSLRLQEQFTDNDTLIILKGQNHFPMSQNKEYQMEIRRILNE